MPTFLKDLSNFQIKLVWQNAGVEIMEAREIIFIGYSLPEADFEFRQLLSRMVHPEAKLRVALYDGFDQEDEAKKQQYKRRYSEEEERYKRFFSGREIDVSGEGATKFINAHLEELQQNNKKM